MPPSQGMRCFQTRMLSKRSHCPMISSIYRRGIPNKSSMKKYIRMKVPEEASPELCSGSQTA